MKKKILTLLLIALLSLSLTACDNSNKEVSSADNFDIGKYASELTEENKELFHASYNGVTKEFNIEFNKSTNITDADVIKNSLIATSKELLEKFGKDITLKMYYEDNKEDIYITIKDGEILSDNFADSMALRDEKQIEDDKIENAGNNIVNELTEETVTDLAKKTFSNADITEALVTNDVVSIKYYVENFWSNKSLIKSNARETVNFVEKLFSNNNVNQVSIDLQGKVIDNKGNESIQSIITFNTDRNTIGEVNWENFKTLVKKDYKNLGNIAKAYNISQVLLED